MSRLLRTSGIFAAILVMLLSSLVVLFPQKALAANETYRWTSNTTVVANGGDLQGDTTFSANAAASPTLFATMTYRTGCQFKVTMSVLFGNASARLTLPQSAGGPGDGITNRCSVEIAQTYNNQVVPIQGTRPGAGDAPETQLQKHVSVTVYSPSAAAQSPQTVTFTWKNSAGATVATTTSPQHSDTAGNSNDPSLQVVRYETGADLDPGTYSVCPSAIVGCQSFTKVKYQGLTLTYGESLSARNINVTLELSVTRADKDPYAVGPIELSLQLADGTGPVVKTQTDRFSTPGVPGSAAVAQSTITLRGTFANVDAGAYKVCTVVSNVCQNVTKDTNRDAAVTLTEALAPPVVTTANTCATQSGSFGFLACPLITWAADAAEGLSVFIVQLLKLDTATLFNSDNDPTKAATSDAFHAAWAGFRNIAYAILVIIGLIMIASQILNIEIFSAYTLRKMLPGIIIAIIFVTLSWDLMEFLYNMSNAAADAVMEIIKLPFQQVAEVRDKDIGTVFGGVVQLILLIGTAGGIIAAYAVLGGPLVVLSLIASLALSIFSMFVLLAARNVVAYFLVIVSPVPIMMAAFEPLKKGYSFWKGLVVVIVITVPGVAGILAVTAVGSAIAAAAAQSQTGADSVFSYISAIVIVIAGVVMVWTLFLQMDKITGFLGNVASKATGKAQQALANQREEAFKRNKAAAIAGEGRFGKGFSGFVANQYRRAEIAKNSEGAFFGARHDAVAQNMRQQIAAKKLQDENGRYSGDDELVQTLLDSKDEGEAITRHSKQIRARAAASGETITEAEVKRRATSDVMGAQAAFGARTGSQLMKAMAYKAQVASVSAFNDKASVADGGFNGLKDDEGVEAMYKKLVANVAPLVANGTLSLTDAVAAIKKNTQRMDLAGHSFPQLMGQLATSVARYKENPQGELITKAEINKWRDGSIQYSQAGAQIAGRTETVRVQGQQEYKQLEVAELKAQKARAKLDPSIVGHANSTADAFAEAQRVAGLAITEDERRNAQDMVEATRQQAITAQQELEAQPAYAEVQKREEDLDRYLASFSVKHDQMGYASKENREVYEEVLLGREMGGQAVMAKIEQRRSRPVFQRLHKEFTQSYGASTQSYLAQQAAQQTAAAAAGGVPQAGQVPTFGSDRWLKEDIHHVGTALGGKINLYRFKYLGDNQEYVGVMAQELLTTHPDVVFKAPDGFYRVNYAKLGVPFLTYEEWKNRSLLTV